MNSLTKEKLKKKKNCRRDNIRQPVKDLYFIGCSSAVRGTESVANVNKTHTSKERKTLLKFYREIFVRKLLQNLILNIR
jgi:hypothetical protein